ncbi:MAG: response regulator [Treponema sp.]|nr:response regulator [Treponema sp.]
MARRKTDKYRKMFVKNMAYSSVLVVILAFAIMVILSSYFMSGMVRRQMVFNAEESLNSLEKTILADLMEPRSILGSVSQTMRDMILHDMGAEIVHEYLNEITEYFLLESDQLSGLVSIYGYFEVFGGILLDGRNRQPPDNFRPRERPWYREAVAAGGRIVFLQPRADIFTFRSIISYARAIFDNDGKLLGIAVLDLHIDRIREYVINANLGKLGFGILLNDQYEFISHVDPALHGRKFSTVSADTARIVDELKLGHGISEFRMVNYLGDQSISFFRRLPNNWNVAIVTPEREYFKEVNTIRIFLTALGVALAAAVSAILISIIKQKQKADSKIMEADKAIVANRYKTDFLAKMSHEIRSPMNVILGITEMQLERTNLAIEDREVWDKVHQSGYLLHSIINDILDMSKIEAGKLELSLVNYSVASMINDSVQLNIMRFESKPIEFHLLVDETVPTTLFGDDLRIKQILNNLISNAFKYTEKGDITLTVTADVKDADVPVNLSFRLKDSGQGMSREQINKLFDEYTRFKMETNRTVEGTGLGMGITRELINLMKGKIDVESELGKGTTFTIQLPQGYVNGNVLGKEGSESLRRLHRHSVAQTSKTQQITREYMPYGKILVVDDMEPNLYVARGLLSPYGLSVETAESGAIAIERIKSGMVFDIIFMDHYMPVMDGIEAVQIIRGMGYNHPIVALTANALVGQAEVFLSKGFNGFISKPIDIRQMNTVLNQFVRDRYPAETVNAARQLKKKMEETKASLPDLSQKRALVVDDFPPNLHAAAGMLRKYKMQVDCLSGGKEAVERVDSEDPQYDLIFIDYLMPEMDGVEAVKIIRSLDSEYAKNVPIIALTAVTAGEAAEKENMFLNNGFNAVLSKPISISKLDAFIKSWVNNISGNGEASLEKKEKDMKIDIPGVDEGRVMELYDGDLEIYLPVLRSYLSAIPETMLKLKQVTAETLPAYVVSVHGVKSTSDSIGAEEARKMALELELLAKAGNLSGVLEKNGALVQYVEKLLVNINNWLAKLDNK